MYNVVIVDDEPVIRFGLKASINWEEEGLHLLGDYPNGYEAFEEIKNHHVDIVITDIKMPIMDGITFMKKTLEIFPKAKVIFVSSYNDFEYVREGLMLGAVDYVLKPTLEPDEFLEVIRKCKAKLNEEEHIKEKLTLLNETESRNERKIMELEVKKILQSGSETYQLEERNSFIQKPWIIVHSTMRHVKKLEDKYGIYYKSFVLDDIHEEYYKHFLEGICIPIADNEMIFLHPISIDPIQFIKKLKQFIEKETNTQFLFGYEVIHSINELILGFQKSMEASKRGFFNPDESIFSYQPKTEFAYKKLKVEELRQFLLPYDEQKATRFIEQRYELWRMDETNPLDSKDEACEIITHLFTDKIEMSILLEKCLLIKNTENIDELIQTLISSIQDLDTRLSQQSEMISSDNELIEHALQYIHLNYSKELTLQNVADHIHISRNYFSILFKKQLNQNFIDYVIDLRIKKAKELLMNTKMKVYEVARDSGFKDVKYFSKLFKKMTGFSAGDYRNQHQVF